MELRNVYPEKIPQKILNKNYVDDIILYALSAFGPLQKAEFNQINKTTFYKYLNKLLEKKFLSSFREGKKAIYEITPSGQTELLKRLEVYKLDFETIIELEKKKINSQISKLTKFFDRYNVNDDIIKIDFLQLYNELTYSESFNIFSEEQFNKLLLFIVMNHPKFFDDSERIRSKDRFLDKFNTYTEGYLSKTDIDMFIQEVVEKNRYGEEIYNLELNKDINLFFRANSKLGKHFETTIQSHLRDLNYLKSLIGSKIYSDDLEEIIKLILSDLIKKHRFFNPKLEESLYYLIEEYILGLQQEQFGDPFLEIEKIKDFSSLISDFPSLSFDFKSFKDSDDDELLIDLHTTFKRIKEKEPMNELYDKTLELCLNEKANEALIEINKLIELEPNNYNYFGLKSQILYDLENYEEALKTFENALNSGIHVDDIEDKIDNATYQAELLTKLKSYEEALYIINNQIPEIIKENKEYTLQKFYNEEYILFDYLKIEADIYYLQKEYKKALGVINKDLRYCLIHKDKSSHYPQYADAISESHWFKSRILIKLDRTNEALDEINKAIEIKPEEAVLHYQKAKVYYQMKKVSHLYRSVKKANKFDSKNTKYLSVLDYSMGFFRGVKNFFIIFKNLKSELDAHKDGLKIDYLFRLIKDEIYMKEKDFRNSLTAYVDMKILNLSKDDMLYVENHESFNRAATLFLITPFVLFDEYLEALFEENKWEPLDKNYIIDELQLLKLIPYEIDDNTLKIWIDMGFLVETKSNFIKFIKMKDQRSSDVNRLFIEEVLKEYKL